MARQQPMVADGSRWKTGSKKHRLVAEHRYTANPPPHPSTAVFSPPLSAEDTTAATANGSPEPRRRRHTSGAPWTRRRRCWGERPGDELSAVDCGDVGTGRPQRTHTHRYTLLRPASRTANQGSTGALGEGRARQVRPPRHAVAVPSTLQPSPDPASGPRVVGRLGCRPADPTRRGPTWAIRGPNVGGGTSRGRCVRPRPVAATGGVACASRCRRRWASGRPG
jgi:hypothetical protein